MKCPKSLKQFQPKEPTLSHSVTKLVSKEFQQFNNKLIETVRKKKNKVFNLPTVLREAIISLKDLVKNKIIDIRKVDKGDVTLVIDYEQRLKIEEKNIGLIAKLCPNQVSNSYEN